MPATVNDRQTTSTDRNHYEMITIRLSALKRYDYMQQSSTYHLALHLKTSQFKSLYDIRLTVQNVMLTDATTTNSNNKNKYLFKKST